MSASYGYGNNPDLTAKQPARGTGMVDMGILWLCGHRGGRTGAKFRLVSGLNPIAWRCAACVTATKPA